MPGSTSIVRAEEKALAGNNESQDSQQVLDAYQRMYGIGLASSSPPQDDDAPFYKFHHSRKHSQGAEGRRKKARKSRNNHSARSVPSPLDSTETPDGILKDRESARSLPSDISPSAPQLDEELALTAPGPPHGRQERVTVDNPGFKQAKPCVVEEPEPCVPDARNATTLGVVGRKMDFSQSPTQSNDGRSYERYFRTASQSDEAAAPHLDEPAQAVEILTESSTCEQKSLLEDDTGAVVFDVENPVANHTDNSLPSDHSPQLARASLRARNFAFQQHTSQSQERPPETPVVRHNPFTGNNHFQLLPTSQLFKATQFSSALRRGASPTSSRPSPNDFPHNTISPNPISSPLKARGLRSSPTTGHVSSPQVMRTTGSPRPEDEQTTPSNTGSTKGHVVPESPRYRHPRPRAAPAPMDVYVPMRQSQERRSSSVVPPETASPELSDDGDDAIDRRRRARSRKEASLKQLTSIQFIRTPKSENVEVPSTNTKKKNSRAAAQEYIDQCHGSGSLDDDSQLQERVENSQNPPAMMERSRVHQGEELTQSSQGDQPTHVEDGIARSSAAAGKRGPKRQRRNGLLRLDSTETNVAHGETIPETSPVEKAPRHRLDSPGATPSAGPKPSSNTVVIGSSRDLNDATGVPKSSVTEYVPPAAASGKSTRTGSGPESPIVVSSSREQAPGRVEQKSSPTLRELNLEQMVVLTSSPPAPAFSTRSMTRQQHDPHVRGETPAVPFGRKLPKPSTSMSTLSALSGTPSLTISTSTPGSQDSAASRKLRAGYEEITNSSPAVAKNKRRRVGDLPQLKTGSTTDSLRASTRLSRKLRLNSTDELAKSPSMTPTFEHSVRGPPRKSISRPMRTSTADLQLFQDQNYRRPGRLFEGMAFAISFQAKKTDESEDEYGERMEAAGSLETRIMQAGGRVLENGFDELFESGPVRSAITSPVISTSSSPLEAADADVNLVPAARHLGFTALVADGHSRKEKYMQALALGLPCIAARWITTCLDSGEIVDWAPYLLCAGQSAFLSGAYKSRILAPYDASQAQLAQVIETRPRLLDGSRVLLVMKKSEKKSEQGKKMMKYVFLARVLGATLCRAQSVNEAKAMVKASQDMGRPFDWVYAGGKVDKTELFADVVTGATNARANSKKRKRGGGNTTAIAGNAATQIRTLTDELVIQSLILGRLIQEGEMEE